MFGQEVVAAAVALVVALAAVTDQIQTCFVIVVEWRFQINHRSVAEVAPATRQTGRLTAVEVVQFQKLRLFAGAATGWY